MKLVIDRLDLLEQYRNINCSQTRLEHFSPETQKAIMAVGQATFVEFDGRSYNVIYAPLMAAEENDNEYRWEQ
mgnify:CR=1 FL=1